MEEKKLKGLMEKMKLNPQKKLDILERLIKTYPEKTCKEIDVIYTNNFINKDKERKEKTLEKIKKLNKDLKNKPLYKYEFSEHENYYFFYNIRNYLYCDISERVKLTYEGICIERTDTDFCVTKLDEWMFLERLESDTEDINEATYNKALELFPSEEKLNFLNDFEVS